MGKGVRGGGSQGGLLRPSWPPSRGFVWALSTFVKTSASELMEEATRGQMENCGRICIYHFCAGEVRFGEGRRRRGGGSPTPSMMRPHSLSNFILQKKRKTHMADLPLWPSLSHIFPTPIIFGPGGRDQLGLCVVREPRRTDLITSALGSASVSAAETPAWRGKEEEEDKEDEEKNTKFMKYSSATCLKMWFNFFHSQ